MNDYERELRKLLDGNTHFDKLTYVVRTCYGQLNAQVRTRIELVTGRIADHYAALQAA